NPARALPPTDTRAYRVRFESRGDGGSSPGQPRSGGEVAPYCSSLTFSSQSTCLPSFASWTAICVTAVVGVAPCQCFTAGGHQTTSPERISSLAPAHSCVQPRPAV